MRERNKEERELVRLKHELKQFWTYKKLKELKRISLLFYEKEVLTSYQGIVGDGAFDIRKGYFWIDVPVMGETLLGKIKNVFTYKNKPLLIFKKSGDYRAHG